MLDVFTLHLAIRTCSQAFHAVHSGRRSRNFMLKPVSANGFFERNESTMNLTVMHYFEVLIDELTSSD